MKRSTLDGSRAAVCVLTLLVYLFQIVMFLFRSVGTESGQFSKL